MRITTAIRKTLPVLLLSVLALLSSCTAARGENEKIEVVATLFPQYDLARTIGGDLAEVTMLLPYGSESHTYDPSIRDVTLVAASDIFIYTGAQLEKWAVTLSENAAEEGCLVLDVSNGITLLEGVDENTDDHAEGSAHNDSHSHDYDGHIWTDPDNAIIMANSICDAYVSLDPDNADYYKENTSELTEQLKALSDELCELSREYDGRTIYFGGRFAFRYMFDRCGFNYRSPYRGCAEDSEPSIRAITEIAEEMKRDGAGYIFREEMSEGKIALGLAEETGAELITLHSCHNLSADEAKAGETYVSIMERNLDSLRKVLSDKQ